MSNSNQAARKDPTRGLEVTNVGTRRIIIGPLPGQRGLVRFDTPADDDAKVPQDLRIGRTKTVEGPLAAHLRKSKVFAALKDRLNLRAA